jgi:hypothetical protein
MSIKEQTEIKTRYFNEAIRYMDNAKETLKKAGKDGDFYKDVKYVKTACGTAYSGVLLALDGYFLIKGIPAPRRRKSIEFYRDNIVKVDRKLMDYLNDTYEVLHLSGYYDGIKSVKVIQSGFELAYSIINQIRPAA